MQICQIFTLWESTYQIKNTVFTPVKVLSLVFYRDSTKEAGPNYMFSDRLLTKWLKIQFRIGSLLNCLLNCADTTLVHPLN